MSQHPEHGLDCRHQLHVNAGGVALPGGGDNFVLPSDREGGSMNKRMKTQLPLDVLAIAYWR